MSYEGDLIEHYREVQSRIRMQRRFALPAPVVEAAPEPEPEPCLPSPEPVQHEIVVLEEEWRTEVMEIVHRHGFSLPELRSQQRDRQIVACRREVATFLAKQRGWSFPQIGRWLHRDHTSILYLVRGKGGRKAQ